MCFLAQSAQSTDQRKQEWQSLSAIEPAARQVVMGLPPLHAQRRTPGPTPDRCAELRASRLINWSLVPEILRASLATLGAQDV